MDIRVTRERERERFFASHMPVVSWLGIARACSCGWSGADWSDHFEEALLEWREIRRQALRARLLAQEGIEEP